MSILFFDCFSGAAGDMILGALIDAGAPEDDIREALDVLGLPDWELTVSRTMKGAISATQVSVNAEDERRSRSYRDIETLLCGAPLASGVKARALKTFELLAEAEAKVHAASVKDVHFHEVGSIDAIVDIVGAAAALEHFSPAEVICSPIATGRGVTQSMHGQIPVPAPAVIEILKGAQLFERGEEEMVTPTGAAILAAASTSFGAMPQLEIRNVGYGAGTSDPDIPNVVRVIEGEPITDTESDRWLIETNLDDMSPEWIPYVIERLLEAGAEDAWSTSIAMKKGRQGVQLSVLVDSDERRAVLDVLYRETTTLGVRVRRAAKDKLQRHWETVEVEGHSVRVKIGTKDGEVINVAAEYEDAAKVARITGLPLKEVYRRANSRR